MFCVELSLFCCVFVVVQSGGVFGRIGQSLRTVKNAMMEYTKNEF